MCNDLQCLRITKLHFPMLYRAFGLSLDYCMGPSSCQRWSQFKMPEISLQDLHPCLLGKIREKQNEGVSISEMS
jgi:hypothetical protein